MRASIAAQVHGPREPKDPHRLFNSYRKGLSLFVLFDRNGKQHGYIYAGSSDAATGRAKSIVGHGATVDYAA